METIHCIFCKNPASSDRAAIHENGFTGRKCSHCGLIYLSPRPTLLATTNLYKHNQAHITAQSHINANFSKRLDAKHHLSILKHYKQEGSLLEVGAGAGYFLDEARRIGFTVYGIELNPIQSVFIRRKFGISCETNKLKQAYNNKTFDIIYHCDVISHFYDPISELCEMNNRLNDRGIMFFETGNLGDVREKYYSVFTKFQYPDHLFFFSEGNLKHLLHITGFELVAIYRYSILLQLLTSRTISKLKSLFNKFIIDNNTRVHTRELYNPMRVSRNLMPRVIRIVKNIKDLCIYFCRYKLGHIIPFKNGQPQSVIIVAKKTKECS